jgi:hypothetical protein
MIHVFGLTEQERFFSFGGGVAAIVVVLDVVVVAVVLVVVGVAGVLLVEEDPLQNESLIGLAKILDFFRGLKKTAKKCFYFL